MPGTRPRTGSHRTRPARTIDQIQRGPGQRADVDWARTRAGSIDPTTSTVTATTATGGRCNRISTASTRAGSGQPRDEVVGEPEQEERGHGQHQEAAAGVTRAARDQWAARSPGAR